MGKRRHGQPDKFQWDGFPIDDSDSALGPRGSFRIGEKPRVCEGDRPRDVLGYDFEQVIGEDSTLDDTVRSIRNAIA